MDLLQAIILSVIEGLTEFLPISSTGHLILTSRILGIPQTEFVKSFEISIQLGAILAVVVLYWKLLVSNRQIWWPVVGAFAPTGILGIVFYGFIKSTLLGGVEITLAALFLGGIFFIVFEKFCKTDGETRELKNIGTRQAVLIGLAQSISMIPGVSRAAASIIGGLLVGLDRKTAVEFSFLLAVPTMIAATSLDLFKTRFVFSNEEYLLLMMGFTGAFSTAVLSIKFFLDFIKTHTFVAFGVYRILLAVGFWLLFG